MTELMVTFRNFANAPKNTQILYIAATERNRNYDPTQVQDRSTYYLKCRISPNARRPHSLSTVR